MDADDAVLVVLMNNAHDLEIVRNEHWYRIPVKHAPAQISRAGYLAFYLTSAFRNDKWSIREYAPVQGNELLRRRDLFPAEADHPRADDAYFKVQLGSLLQLPRPIVSRVSRRMLFLWTTGARFSTAVEISDLISDGGAGDALWQALKEQGIQAERQVTVRDGRARYRVDFWIPCARGDIALNLFGETLPLPKSKKWRAVQLSEKEIEREARASLARIQKLIRELGGNTYSKDRTIQ